MICWIYKYSIIIWTFCIYSVYNASAIIMCHNMRSDIIQNRQNKVNLRLKLHEFVFFHSSFDPLAIHNNNFRWNYMSAVIRKKNHSIRFFCFFHWNMFFFLEIRQMWSTWFWQNSPSLRVRLRFLCAKSFRKYEACKGTTN